MRARIFHSTVCIVLAALIGFSMLLSVGLYFVFAGRYQSTLEAELKLLAASLDDGEDPASAFQRWASACEDVRLTLIGPDGRVLCDTEADPLQMENHGARPEIAAALTDGAGSDRRVSATLEEMTFYVAQRLPGGQVLRLAGAKSSIFSIMLGALACVLLAMPVTLAAGSALAGRTTRSILKPIDALDLDHPAENEIYDEFTPLLARLSAQNRRIESQMQALARQQNEFTAITENMSEGLVILNARAEILTMNRSARTIFRAGEQDYTGRYALSLYRSPELMKALQDAEQGRASSELMRMGGRVLQLISSPVSEDGAVSGILLLIPDVTERVEAEQNRREFSANVSHELKTPLTSILGYAELMQNGLVPAEDIPRFSGQIYAAAQRLLRLVEDIIHLSRLDENSAPVETGPVDLAEAAAAVCDRMQRQADAAGIPLHRQLHSATVEAAPNMIDELLTNLIDNAIKYNRPGGDVTVETQPLADGARLVVRDTGIGVAPEHHEKIFERFYRVDKSHSREIDGTGLGLSIVKHIAAFHGAELTIDSAPGAGTAISVRFHPTLPKSD